MWLKNEGSKSRHYEVNVLKSQLGLRHLLTLTLGQGHENRT